MLSVHTFALARAHKIKWIRIAPREPGRILSLMMEFYYDQYHMQQVDAPGEDRMVIVYARVR